VKILYLCHRIPYPPNKGDKIRAFYQLRAMAMRHEVDLFTLADDRADLDHQAELERICRRVVVRPLNPLVARIRALPTLLTRSPLTVPYFYSAELERAVQAALQQRRYDRIFVYCSAMGQYIKGVGQIPTIMDFVDVDSDKWSQYSTSSRFPFSAIYRREASALRRYEGKVAQRSACVVVTTEREARLARQIAGCPVHVIPNGVDTTYFAPPKVWPASGAPVITFVGDMGYFPNQEAVESFANRVLPLVREAVPEARFWIVGRNPSRKVQKLGKLPGVSVTGFVPDIRTYLAQSQVIVAPFSIAAGIQNKILEALSFGLPVVATSRAAQGLAPEVAQVVETADDPDSLADKVAALLRDPDRARGLGSKGRRCVDSAYNWERSSAYLLQLLEDPSSTPGTGAGAAYSRSLQRYCWKTNC